MEKPSLEKLAHRVMSDPVFRSQFMADPEFAINEAGWDLPPEDIAALKAWHANMNQITKIEELERSLAHFLASRTPGV